MDENEMMVPAMAELNMKERKAVLFPELAPKMAEDVLGTVDENKIRTAADSLWRSVAKEALDLSGRVLAPLDAFSTNLNNLGIESPDDESVQPIVNVLAVESAGDAIVNATNWNKSNIKGKYHPVQLDRISRPFGVSGYDLQHGENLQKFTAAAVNSACMGAFRKVMAAIGAAQLADATEVALDAFNAAYVVDNISCLFGDLGETHALVASPRVYSKLRRRSALDLGMDELGVGAVYQSAALSSIGEGISAFANRREAIVVGGGTPKIYDEFRTIATRNLGTVGGLPLLLKFHEEPGAERVFCSVETMIGAKVVAADRVVKYAIAAGGTPAAGDTPDAT